MANVEHMVSSQCKLGEGPVWHPVEQVLYWLDIYNGQLHRFDPSSSQHTSSDLGMVTGCLGLRQAGGFVMAAQKGLVLWDSALSQYEALGEPDAEGSDVRFNDGKTDHQGRFWAGKMGGAQPLNHLFRLDSDRQILVMEGNIGISNGLGWSPDDSVFYFTDSQAKMIYAYDFNPANGKITNKRVFASIPQNSEEGFPDGLTIDEEGCIWSARWGGWKLVRYTPDGRIEREIPVPVEFPTSCTFGGPNLDELFITSAWVEVDPQKRSEQPLAGDVFRLKTNVRGLPEPFFKG